MNAQTNAPSYLGETRAILSPGPLGWLTTLDHKRLGVLYLVTSGMALLGAAILNGLHRGIPALAAVGLLFLAPSIPATLGTFLLPLELGQKSAALPRVSLAGFWLYVLGAGAILAGLATTDEGKLPAVLPMVAGGFALGTSMMLTALSFLATTAKAFVNGAPSSRFTLFAWSLCATSVAVILGLLAVGGLIVIVVISHEGLPVGLGPQDVLARILTRQEMFVSLLVVPAVGIVSDVFAAFTGRKRGAGYGVLATSLVVLAWLGLVECASLLRGVGEWPLQLGFATSVFAAASAVVVLAWVATLYRGRIVLATPLLWALGCLFQLTLGAPAGLLLGVPPTGIYLHDTLYELGYRHEVIAGAAAMGFGAGLSYFWPKITGKLYDERLARVAFVLVFVGMQLAFLSEMVQGVQPEWTALASVSAAGMWVLTLGGVATFAVLAASLRRGAKAATENPWGVATGGLEWTVVSPPPLDNFTTPPKGDTARSDESTLIADRDRHLA